MRNINTVSTLLFFAMSVAYVNVDDEHAVKAKFPSLYAALSDLGMI